MNILSCFDGISCGRIALDKAGIKVNKYFASEINKYALQISQKNYPDIIQLGDICNWEHWELPYIDLLIAGSPCQGFSYAGKGLNFEDSRSKLFFKFVDVLKYYKPKWFLLENVVMKKEYENIISGILGVAPILINSSLVSAQNRKRLYWTNIPNINMPEDKGICLKDVLEKDVEPTLVHNLYGGFGESKPRVFTKKSPTIRTSAGGGHIPSAIKIGNIYPSGGQMGNIYSVEGKSPPLTSGTRVNAPNTGGDESPKISLVNNTQWRMLSPLECERLQTIPDNYTEGVSRTQRYKSIGNGWTVDIISHIFSFIPKENE